MVRDQGSRPALRLITRTAALGALLLASCGREEGPETLVRDTAFTARDGARAFPHGLVVPAGVTLTLGPGAHLTFGGGALAVAGTLDASGENGRPVVLDATGPSGWQGLRIGSGARARLSHVRLASAGSERACIVVEDAALDASHLDIADPRNAGIEVQRSSLDVRDSVFPAFGEHEVIHGHGLSPEKRLDVRRCEFHPVMGFHDIIDFAGCTGSGWVGSVQDSRFAGGSDDGIDVDACDIQVSGCTFRDFRRQGHEHVASGISAGTGARIDVTGCTFEGNDSGLAVKEAAFATLVGCRITGSSLAAFVMSERGSPGGGLRLIDTTLDGNAADFEAKEKATGIEWVKASGNTP